jgi:hypothetical protein
MIGALSTTVSLKANSLYGEGLEHFSRLKILHRSSVMQGTSVRFVKKIKNKKYYTVHNV